jgi:uroporphyrinogen decarboxylase
MNSRQRVRCALNHQEPDRIPIDLGGTLVTSITVKAYASLKRHLGMPLEEIKMLDYVQQLPYVDEALQMRFGADFRMVQVPAITAKGVDLIDEGDAYTFYNRWGVKAKMPKDGGLYFDYVEFPIREATMEALDRYEWPLPNPPEANLQLREAAQRLYTTTDYALVGGVVIGGGIFEQPARLMGLENFFMALVSEPAVADRMMEKMTDLYIEASEAYLDEVGQYLDVIVYWDDVCGQNGWLIRPDLYAKMVKPKQRRLVEAIKKKTGARLFYHGCGAVFDLIPHLIETGFDIINPVQVSARGMDTRRLKESFGREITFWGGGVDTQQVLPFGTPREVADEVKRRIDDLAPGGGFVFAPVHNIQAFVPPENIVAAYDTALETGRRRPE